MGTANVTGRAYVRHDPTDTSLHELVAKHLETFVRFAGGEYFFLPSLPTLDYLEGLG